MAYRLNFSDYDPPAAPPAPPIAPPTGGSIPGGPAFIGFPQPPDVPCDPTGDGWRGPPGPPGPPMGAFVTDTPPANPVQGQLWFDSSNPQLYVWYYDGNSYQWVIATAYAGGLTSDAPSDGHVYGRQNGAWTDVSTTGVPYLPLVGGTVSGPTTFQAGLELTGGALTTLLGGHLRDPASVPTARWMVDFQQVTTAAGGLIRGTNFSVGGGGNTRIGFGALKPDPTGLIIDTDGHQAASATVATPGSGYVVGYITDVPGNIWHIDSIDVNGGVTAVTLNKAILTSTTLSPLSLVAPDWSPAATGCTLNVTYASGTTLSVQPSGGPTVFGGPVTHTGTPATPSAGQGSVGGVATNGLVLTGNGSTNDVAVQNRAGLNALMVLGNTTTVRVPNANSNAPSLIVGGGGATSLANGMVGLFNVANTANFTGTTGAGKNVFLSSIQYTGDQIDSSAGSAVNGLFLSHNWGGGSTRGGRIALNVTAIQSAPSLSTASRFYQAFAPSILALTNDGGAVGDYRGKYFVMNPISTIQGGATYIEGVCNTELDVAVQATLFTGSISGTTLTVTGGPAQGVLAIGQTVTGAGVTPFAIVSGSGTTWTLSGSQAAVGPVAMSALGQIVDKSALVIVQLGTDAVMANRVNSAIRITNQANASTGWTQGITFGDENGWWAITPTGTLMGTRTSVTTPVGPAYTAAIGIDFSAITFSTAFLKSTGFQVDGSGRCSPMLTNAANDAAAASAGVPIGAMYRNGNAVQVRLV